LGKLIDLSDFKSEKDRRETVFKNIANNFKQKREQIKTLIRKEEFLNKLKSHSILKEPITPVTARKSSSLSNDKPLLLGQEKRRPSVTSAC